MTIRTRLTLSIIVLVAFIVAGLSTAIYVQAKNSEEAQLDVHLASVAAAITEDVEDEWEDELDPEWSTILEVEHDKLPGLEIALHTAAGECLVSTDSLFLSHFQGVFSEPLAEIVYQSLTVTSGPYRVARAPVIFDETVGFVVTLAAPATESLARLDQLAIVLVLSSCVAIAIAGFSVSWVTKKSFAPVEQMIRAAEQIQEGSLDQRIPVASTGDEVARLGVTLNAMMARIESAFATQKQFVADASHELRTPLTVVIGELEHLQRETLSATAHTSIRTSLDELDRLAQIVDSLLSIARADAGRLALQKKTVRLDELVVETIAFLDPQAKKHGVELTVEIDEAVEILADDARLKSVLIAVIENGLLYTDRGGKVAVHLHAPEDNRVAISFRDTGAGVPQEDIPHIFNRFHRSARDRAGKSGSGLGLPIARRLAELHGGTLELSHTGPTGSTFRLILPCLS